VTYGDHVELDHQSDEPLYLQLAGMLRAQIESGELTGRLPSVKTLSQEYAVSHVTSEKAMGVLKAEGLIRVRIGKGAYVAR
jgi:DNA-binding GntR family transcriptional regulator